MARSKQAAKDAATARITGARESIIAFGEAVMDDPELGFKEFHTSERTYEQLSGIGLDVRTGLGITGLKAVVDTGRPGPTVAVMGELDAIGVPGHPRANPETGAAHACGHNAQLATMTAAARALTSSELLAGLSGRIVFMALPAEEYVEIGWRKRQVDAGRMRFLGGKPEMIADGAFDDIDMAVLVHSSSKPAKVMLCESENGCAVKQITFFGRAAHAGAAPHLGTNALYAAQVALAAINALRETFPDADCTRVHPIITRGGDIVNVIPHEVTMETFVRGANLEAIARAEAKVDRALRAGAMALGASVEIANLPGYMPLTNCQALADLCARNAHPLFGEGSVVYEGHRPGSTDMGDLSRIMPVLQPQMAGMVGSNHAEDWAVADLDGAYIDPGILMSHMVIDLLWDDAAVGAKIVDEYQPELTRAGYLAAQDSKFAAERWDYAEA